MSDILIILDPRGAWISPSRISVQYFFGDFQPPAQETNQHFIGRFAATKHVIRRDLLFHGAWDPPAQETNTHWIGRFTPTTHRLGRHLSFQDFQSVPTNEANPHWTGKYTAQVHTIRRDLLWSWAWDPLAAETNTHWTGRFRPATHALLAASRQNSATDIFVAPAVETNPHWFGTHWQTSFNVNLANMQGGDFNQVETNPNSIARFTTTTHKILASLRQHQDFQTAVVAPQPETNPHFLGTFTPTRHIVNLGAIQGGDFNAVETNPNFIGRFRPYVHTVARHLNHFQHGWDTAAVAPQAEANPHFIANFTPYIHTVNVANIQGGDFNAAETNPNTIGRFKPTTHVLSRHLNLFQHGWDTFVAPVVAETNPHWLGTFTPTRHIVNLGAIQGGDFAAVETNPNFIGRFTAQRFTLSRHLNIWKSDSDSAFQAAQPETNPHWIGNFTPYVHTINVANIQGGDFAQVETNPNFIGRFTATKHTVARHLIHFQHGWDTFTPAVQAETNPSFLGRFAAQRHRLSPHLITWRSDSEAAFQAPQAETNPNFLGKFTPNQIRILPSLRQNPATDFIVGPVVPPTEGAGGERWPRYSWRWCDFTDREWFKAFCEEFYRLKSLKSPELRRQQLADLEQALDLAIERAVGGSGEPEWTFDIHTAGGMLQDEIGSSDAFDRIASGLARLALEIDDEEAFLLLGS